MALTHRYLLALCLAIGVAQTAGAANYTFNPTPSDLNDLDHQKAYTWGISSAGLKTDLTTGGLVITSAVLTISDLYNWDAADTNNQLFIHLLDSPLLGTNSVTDDPTANGINTGVVSDYFTGKVAGNKVGLNYVAYGLTNDALGNVINGPSNGTNASNTNILLDTYHDNDGPTTHVNYSYNLLTDPLELSTLTSYIMNGANSASGYAMFGLGFDGDCHYYNNGITLTITTGGSPGGQQTSVPDSGATLSLLGLALLAVIPCRRLFAVA